MNRKTLKACLQSVEHWKRVANGKAGPNERLGPDDCALCKLFLDDVKNTCDGCPVKKKTGQDMCMGTPYHETYDVYFSCGVTSGQFKAAAKRELKFLTSLLPKTKPTKGKP